MCVKKSNDTEGCVEEFKQCKDITVLGNFSCSDFPTSNETYACISSGQNDSTCIEMNLCNYVEEGSERLTNDICKKYPVSKENAGTHICIEKDSKCVEKHLC